ncbi:MAG: ABC transporter permease [Actinobacteria bacterium]|nr:ABC transporter permease [Actinomycetota bacterium]MBV9256129.1 ABC transporter permease [Actinomycetota bacterium]
MQAVRDRVSGLGRAPRAALWIVGGVVLWPIIAAFLPRGAPVGVVLVGAVLGTVTALLAMGLILIYRTNRIINFAYGSMGGAAGVISVDMFITHHVNYYVASILSLIIGVVAGGLIEFLIIRRFANSSRLVLTVATIGLAQVLGGFELLIPKWMGSPPFFGSFPTPLKVNLTIDPIIFKGSHLLIVASVPVVIAGLAWFLLRTDAGVAVRAAAENSERALLLGIPIRRLSTIVWMVAGGLATLTFILKAPFAGTASGALTGPSLLLPALATAVVARMESLPVAFGAGVGLGILEQVVLWNYPPSAVDVAYLLVILLALLLRRDRLTRALDIGASSWSDAGMVRAIPRELRKLPEVRGVRIALGVLVGAFVVILPLFMTNRPSDLNLMSIALVWGIVAVSLVVLTGWGGHISLGQFAIVGTGAVTSGLLQQHTNTDFFVTLAAAGAVGGMVALLLGLPALRIRGPFLAVTTLAFAVALDSHILNPSVFPKLIPDIGDRPVLFQRFPLESERATFYLCLAILALTIVVAQGIRKSRAGRVLIATRENDRAAGAAAVPTTAAKLSGFILAGVMAGIAGGLHVLILHHAGAGTYQPSQSLDVFAMAVIGGLGSIGGALLGVFSIRLLEQVVSGAVRLVITGAGLLVILLFLRGGIAEALMRMRNVWLRWVAKRRGIVVPSLLADKRVPEEEDHAEDEVDLIAAALEDEPSASPEKVSV